MVSRAVGHNRLWPSAPGRPRGRRRAGRSSGAGRAAAAPPVPALSRPRRRAAEPALPGILDSEGHGPQLTAGGARRAAARPDIYLILLGFIVLAAGLTWIVPAGSFERAVLPDGREVVIPGSYRVVESSPAGFLELVTAVPKGLREASSIVFLVLLVGGSVGVVHRAGILDLGIRALTRRLGGRSELLIPVLMAAFSAVAALVGTPELAIAYLPVVLPLLLRLGYDTVTATAVALIPTSLGYAFGVTAPSTIGIGHALAGLPMFSGAGFRSASFAAVQMMAAVFVLRYARRVRTRPETALNPEGDAALRRAAGPDAAAESPPAPRRLAWAAVAALVLFLGSVAAFVVLRLGFEGISGLFVLTAVVASVVAGRGANRICDDFNSAFRDMLVGALICGLARGVSVVMVEASILDTVVFHLAALVAALPEELTAVGILYAQSAFNFLVPSGSGQSLLTLPILVPVGDLIGVTRQVVVLATHWGDGITNIVFPTSGYFLATLVIGRVSLRVWLRFYLPLFWYVLGFATVGLVVAHAIPLGPF